MRFDKYFKLSCERFPEMNFDKIINNGWNRVDLIHKVAECLFVADETKTELAHETRDQLVNLSVNGVHCFEA